MATITTTTHLILDSAGNPADGTIFFRQTARFVTSDALVTTTQGRAAVKRGALVRPLVIPETPVGEGVEIIEVFGSTPSSRVPVTWWTEIDDSATIEYADLPVVVPPTSGGGVPSWAADLLQALEDTGTLNDPIVAALVEDAASDTALAVGTVAAQASSVALAPLRAIAIGDSTTQGLATTAAGTNIIVSNFPSGLGAIPTGGEVQAGYTSWFVHLCLMSGGRLINWFNAGIGSDTTDGMVARFQGDVLDRDPDVVFLGNAHNDFSVGSGITEAETRANITAMVVRARAAGAGVILVTCYPENSATYAATIRRHNRWLKKFGEANRVPVVDLYSAVVDPASSTGAWTAAHTTDGTHASVAGAKAAAQVALDSMEGVLRGKPFGTPWLPSDSVVDVNRLVNPMMLSDTNSDHRPDSWTLLPTGTARTLTDAATTNSSATMTSATGAFTSADIGRSVTGSGIQASTFISSVFDATTVILTKNATATATGVTVTLGGVGVQIITDPDLPAGRLVQFTVSAGNVELYQSISVDGSNFSVGDRVKWCGVFEFDSTSTLTPQLSITATGVGSWSPKPVHLIPGQDYELAYFEIEVTIPVGATALKPDLFVASGTGVARTGFWGLYNLTKLGT